MSVRTISFFTCLLISILCLAAGYALPGHGIGALIALLIGLVWLPARKHPASGLPTICLISSAALAVAGLLTGSPGLWMICGVSFALAGWDLLSLEHALKQSSWDGQTRRYETRHLQSLALALGFGLIVVFVGLTLHLEIPFVVMILCVILAVFAFERAWNALRKRRGYTP